MEKLSIVGVPEHFNYPWHWAIERGLFEDAGIDLQWQDAPGGTGAMAQMLAEEESDLAVLLTEGCVAAIIKGNPSRIVQSYIASPLTWGIHVDAKSSFQDIEDVEGKTYAISRYGSGSHLMAYVDAQQRGWNTGNMKFNVVGNFNGAKKALANGEADLFMWEKFMTKPTVDSGIFRRIGECPTPWPCFAITANEKALQNKADAIEKMLDIIQKVCLDFEYYYQAVEIISEKYGLLYEDAETWFYQTDWTNNNLFSVSVLEKIMDTLLEVKVIDHKVSPDDLCSDFCQLTYDA